MKSILLILVGSAVAWGAPLADPPVGLWQSYNGEWGHVSQQLVLLAEAIPAEKFDWRPASGVRLTSEVFLHIAVSNFGLLSVTGPALPADLRSAHLEKVKSKPELITRLKRSLEAVRNAHAGLASTELQRKVQISNREATVEGIYLRILIHANEHMGQLIAFARMNGIVPPWSEEGKR